MMLCNKAVGSDAHPVSAGDQPVFEPGSNIAAVNLVDWLEWVTSKTPSVFVALPMLQRGSVWDTAQVIELWDSLLRGMPIGSFLVSSLKSGMVRRPGVKRAAELTVPSNSLSLLDGQQRTLAMCLGWPGGPVKDRCIWIDFGKPATGGQPFSLRITSKYHPFGFKPNDPRQKLTRSERRDARRNLAHKHELMADYDLPLDEVTPYHASDPHSLHKLVAEWQQMDGDKVRWSAQVKSWLLPEHQEDPEVGRRVESLGLALLRLHDMQIALVRVPDDVVDADDADYAEELPLAALFKRIANNGTSLSEDDHVFALIKHRVPATHNLVYDLHDQHHIASLLTANELVMTAVRLAATEARHASGEPFADVSRPNAKQFHSLLKAEVNGGGHFLDGAFLPLIQLEVADRTSLAEAFRKLDEMLSYRPVIAADPGLPRLAMPLLRRPLIQPLVYWMRRELSESFSAGDLTQSRSEIVRFVLFWLLCVATEEKEQDKASRMIFKHLREHQVGTHFPGRAMAELLCDAKLALRLQGPEDVEGIAFSGQDPRFKPDEEAPLRNWWARFEPRDDEAANPVRDLYARWWTRKQMLLWLQRDWLVNEFPTANPLAGRDEETPYDYDHLCPRDHWFDFRRIGQFCARNVGECSGNRVLGNSIGNLRVVGSSMNRSDGDASLEDKVDLSDPEALSKSAIDVMEVAHWRGCSRDQAGWDLARAIAFRDAVENRAFNLYRRFYLEGGFGAWDANSQA